MPFVRRTPQGAPSTQFAATIVAPLPTDEDAQAPAPTSAFASDSLATDEPGSAAVPDVVTDVGNLPHEAPEFEDTPTISRIGRYALKRQLGVGGLGTVFEAWDPLLSRTVAIKMLHLSAPRPADAGRPPWGSSKVAEPHLLESAPRPADAGRPPWGSSKVAEPHLLESSPSAQAQGHPLDGLLLNEARAAAGLNHRYIVTIHDAGLSPHGVYIAMERLHGRDLQRALAEGWKPSVEQSVLLVRRVADALAYAHARGVVHCDIKPANIFLQRKDRPKVLDFGIARLMHGAGLPLPEGTIAGSPRYRAPEQLVDAPIDARTDLFSLGVVLYELLTGARAFGGSSLGEIDRAVLQHTPTPAHERSPEVPPEISAIAARLMEREPARRYPNAVELSADLRRWLAARNAQGETGVMAALPPVGTPSRPGRTPRPPAPAARWLLAAALASGMAAMTLGLGAPWSSGPPTAEAMPSAAAGDVPAPPQAQAGSQALQQSALASAAAAPAASAGLESAGADGDAPGAATALAAAAPEVAKEAPPNPRTARSEVPGKALRTGPARARSRADEDGQTQGRRTESAAPAPAATGALLLAVSPWGEVEVDGQPSGTTPPLTRLALPAGTHTVTLRNADFPPHTVQVQVSADKAVTLRHRFGS